MVERVLEAVVLCLHAACADVRRHVGLVKDLREVEAARLRVVDRFACFKLVDATDHLVYGAEAQPRHDLPQLVGDEPEVVDEMLRLAGELLAQFGILRRHAARARVQVALAHHDAAHDDQRHCREPELLGAEQARDRHVSPGLHLAVDLDDDPAPQVVQHERLVRLGQPKLPRQARVLD